MAGSYNHALRNATNSDLGRILFVSFSDYYHQNSKLHPFPFAPNDDFEVPLFSPQWGNYQWNYFYNFMLQCLQLFLRNFKNPILSPAENIFYNNLKATIGDNFLEWADGYFIGENLNQYIKREQVTMSFKESLGGYKVTANLVLKKLKDYCALKNYVFNPSELLGLDGRIMHTEYVGQVRRSVEYFYIRTPKQVSQENPQNEVPF